MRVAFEVAFLALPPPLHLHYTDGAQKLFWIVVRLLCHLSVFPLAALPFVSFNFWWCSALSPPALPCHIMIKPHHIMVKPQHIMTKPHHVMVKPHHTMMKPHHVMVKPHHIMMKPHHIMVKPNHVITNDHIRKLWISIGNNTRLVTYFLSGTANHGNTSGDESLSK